MLRPRWLIRRMLRCRNGRRLSAPVPQWQRLLPPFLLYQSFALRGSLSFGGVGEIAEVGNRGSGSDPPGDGLFGLGGLVGLDLAAAAEVLHQHADDRSLALGLVVD